MWSAEEIESLVARWIACTLPAREWTHAAHVVTCSSLIWNNTLARSYELMKEGLFRFNAATGTPNTEDRGYHETLTRFWSTLLFYEIHRGHYASLVVAVNAMVDKYAADSRADRAYYSFDVLSDKKARRQWVAPDRPCVVPLEAFRW